MKKIVLIFLYFGFIVFAKAQNTDSIFTEIKEGRLFAVHKVLQNENIYEIAQMYNVPAVVLGQNNDISFYEKLEPNRKLFVPLGNYNYLKSDPGKNNNYKPLYYATRDNDRLEALAEMIGVSASDLLLWNPATISTPPNNTLITVGWVSFEAKKVTQDVVSATKQENNLLAQKVTIKSVKKDNDTVRPIPGELEKIYNYQTSNGQVLDSTSGMVVFYKPQTNVDKNLLYAFSSEIARGRVVKIVNPSNGKFVFAKIIGNLPNTKQYQNAKIGLDGRARDLLETREVKLWCDFFLKH